MGKFKDYFAEPVYFTGEMYVIDGELDVENVIEIFSYHFDEEFSADDLRRDFVRFGYPPEDVAEREELGACWYTGAKKGKGAMPVWVFDR